jgi:hypothetical protein
MPRRTHCTSISPKSRTTMRIRYTATCVQRSMPCWSCPDCRQTSIWSVFLRSAATLQSTLVLSAWNDRCATSCVRSGRFSAKPVGRGTKNDCSGPVGSACYVPVVVPIRPYGKQTRPKNKRRWPYAHLLIKIHFFFGFQNNTKLGVTIIRIITLQRLKISQAMF